MNAFPPVVIEREYKASIERVFNAWTQPDLLVQWFRASETTVVHSVELDLRVGGTYRIAVGSASEPWVLFGTYTQIEAPHLLEFTWMWEEAVMEPHETLVKVELSSSGEGTRLRLTHSKFSNQTSSEAHGMGWNGVLSSLALLLS